MKNKKEQYAEVVDSAAELADYFFDQERISFYALLICT